MLRSGLIATKIGNSSYFHEDGKNTHVTLIKVDECIVSNIKTFEKDGYNAVQLASIETEKDISNINKLSVGQRLKIPVKGGLYSNYPEKKIYTVKKGDTLGHIAEDYNTRASEIRKWHNMGSSSNIYPGQKLTLFVKGQPVKDTPKKNVYIVKVGDNLSTIAKNNDTTVSKIKSWNSMKSSTIYPGQKLTIYFE